MRKLLVVVLVSFIVVPVASAVPDIQLFIGGAGFYDWNTETWVTAESSFDLYVIYADDDFNTDIIVSLALAPTDDPAAVTVTFGGTVIAPGSVPTGSWTWGYAPIEFAPPDWDGGDEDLPRHGMFPTWFTQQNTGSYSPTGMVGDVQPGPDFWNPETNTGPTPAPGEFKVFSVEVGGAFSYIHFDAYTLNPDGSIDDFAPFSHDAEVVPEPGTLALFGTGIVGIGIAAFRRRFRK